MTQLPRWVEVGAFILAMVAGSVNAIGLLSFEHQSVSHVSGTATQLGAQLLHQPPLDSLHLLGILLAFLCGAYYAFDRYFYRPWYYARSADPRGTIDIRRAKLFVLIIAGFILGAFLGALAYARYSLFALIVPASICLLLSVMYRRYSKRVSL